MSGVPRSAGRGVRLLRSRDRLTGRWTWLVDRVMPRSWSSGTKSVVRNSPQVAMSSPAARGIWPVVGSSGVPP